MRIEIERFADNRLKMKTKYDRSDRNVRISQDGVDVVKRFDEVELERDVLEAVNLWNLMFMFPDVKSGVHQVLEQHLPKSSKS